MPSKMMWVWVLWTSLVAPRLVCEAPAAGTNLLLNGGFEKGLEGWHTLWTRDAGVGTASLDTAERQRGAQAVRIDHEGAQDWSLGHTLTLEVRPGDIYELAAWVRVRGAGAATLGVVTRDPAGRTLNWMYAARRARQATDWQFLRARFAVPSGAATIWPRLTGYGPATVWCDDVVLERQETLDALRNRTLPAAATLRNAVLEVSLQTGDGTFTVKDLRTGGTWGQWAGDSPVLVLDLKTRDGGRTLDLRILDPSSMLPMRVTARLDGDRPELSLTIRGDGEMHEPIAWPAAFASATGQILILPVNEGISYPVDDVSLPAMKYHLYGGHGLCMGWYGAMAEDGAGWMALVETPDDAAVAIPRHDGLLRLKPEWLPQKGRFGPERVIRYVFLDRGGYVAMAKRYREYAKQTGLFRTLRDKQKDVPAVDLLVGAVNVWCWEDDAPAICREMRSLGIRRILWSNARPAEELKALNAMGVLTSRYDIYQDAMAPTNFPKLKWIHDDWTSDAWANDELVIGADGDRMRGWQVEAKDGTMIPCGILCDRQALAYARRRIPPDLAARPYRCRFIDTTTASAWRECYQPQHPMTRTQSKQYRMDLLRYVGQGRGLVCGSETGHDAAVPYVHYFEGMLSLGPYRIPDAGRNMRRIWEDVPEPVAKFQTGHAYRLPLWELVYHDCVVAHWYWGDYNNKLPALWDRRDLWNALYGTPPMFMFDRKGWEANKHRFVQSYAATAPIARGTGYAEMLSHEWLTPDHAVQQTRFANGVSMTVNFGDTPFQLPDGTRLPPLGRSVQGLNGDT